MIANPAAPVRPQPAFLLLGQDELASPVLDIGAGPGDLAIHLAARGYDVLGIDVDARAVASARARAVALGSGARFLQLDVFDAPTLGKRFRTIVDSGFLHTLDSAERLRLAGALAALVEPDGVYHVLGFAEVTAGARSATPLDEHELARVFGEGWCIRQLRDARYTPPWNPEGVRAVLASLVRSLR